MTSNPSNPLGHHGPKARDRQTATEARDRYDRDPRFRAIAQSVVHEAMQEYTRRNPDADLREADDLATRVAAILMERLFKDNAELRAQREMADRYRKIAEDALLISQPRFIMKAPPHD